MDAKGQCKIARIGYAVLAIAVFCGGLALLYGGCSRDSATSSTGTDSASASQQVERATDLNERARKENQSARAAVESADERAAEAAGINQRVAERLANSKELLGQIRADNQRAKQLLDELIAGHQGEAAQGAEN